LADTASATLPKCSISLGIKAFLQRTVVGYRRRYAPRPPAKNTIVALIAFADVSVLWRSPRCFKSLSRTLASCRPTMRNGRWNSLSAALIRAIMHCGRRMRRRFNQARRNVKMVESKKGLWRRTGAMLAVAAGLLAISDAASPTTQSQQRQQGRNANQAAKHEARTGKVDCRAANQKSNSQCRQDKRDTKQEGRQQKRDIKY
jgi:hypothetical protein